ncbi:MAG: hypothetical protein B6D36_17880 [Planctomycetes bacterium UTPLA1]|jgi:hypothetical protein|nr:MAG: hypothetical protein B6D36_17880 [Planctomycetes bacterium UTPLA1]
MNQPYRQSNQNRQYRQGPPQEVIPPSAEPDRLRWEPIFFPDSPESGQQTRGPGPGRRASWLPGVVALGFFLVAIIMVITFLPEIRAFFSTMDDIGSRDPRAQLRGLIAVGLIGVTVVAVVRILANNKRA